MKGQLLTAMLACITAFTGRVADTIEKGKQIAWIRKKGTVSPATCLKVVSRRVMSGHR